MKEARYQWMQGPDGSWFVAQVGPELFAIRIPGSNFVYGTRDFTHGPIVEKPKS